MTYEKNTWANGDVITAAKLNNMEDGIANAGGGSGCWVTVIAEGFGPEEELALGELMFVEEIGSGQYAGQLVGLNAGSLYGQPIEYSGRGVQYFYILLPPTNDIQLMFTPDEEAGVECSFSGNISTTPVTVRREPGASVTMDGYAITGDCSITLTAV